MSRISRADSVTISTSSVQVAPARPSRVGIYVTNTSAIATVATIVKGDTPAVAGAGIPLQPKGTWYDVDNGEGYRCWKGAVQIVGDGAGTIAVQEDMEL